MTHWLARAWIFAALLTSGALSVAADLADSAARRRITDITGTLSAQQVQTLDSRLAQFEARKGAQIAVLLVPTAPSPRRSNSTPCEPSRSGSLGARRSTTECCW